jgi:Putative DNA-binding domain
VSKTGKVRVALPGGLPSDAWLFLSRDRQWLDYRMLGLDVAGRVGAAASGIEVDLTDDPVTEIRALLSIGERPRIEYKRQLPESTTESKKKVLKTVAAFANQDGGHIIFGVDPDEVTLVGVGDVDVNGVRDRLGQLIHGNVVPPDPVYDIRSVAIDGKMLVVLEIRPSSGRPYGLHLQDKPVEFYMRRGGSTYPATQAEVRAMAQPAAQQRGFPGFPFSGSYA